MAGLIEMGEPMGMMVLRSSDQGKVQRAREALRAARISFTVHAVGRGDGRALYVSARDYFAARAALEVR